jgi:hypothetical protein
MGCDIVLPRSLGVAYSEAEEEPSRWMHTELQVLAFHAKQDVEANLFLILGKDGDTIYASTRAKWPDGSIRRVLQ